jgi:hypothetical protein
MESETPEVRKDNAIGVIRYFPDARKSQDFRRVFPGGNRFNPKPQEGNS